MILHANPTQEAVSGLTSGFPGNNRDAKPPPGVPLLTKPYRREALARALRDALADTPATTHS